MSKAKDQKDKNSYIDAADEAIEKAHLKRDADVADKKWTIEEAGTRHYEGQIKLYESIIDQLQENTSGLSISETRKLIAAAKAEIIFYEELISSKKAKIDAGLQMDKNSAGKLSEREKRIIKVTRKQIKAASDHAERKLKKLGKGKLPSGKKVGKVLRDARRTLDSYVDTAKRNAGRGAYGYGDKSSEYAIAKGVVEIAKKQPSAAFEFD